MHQDTPTILIQLHRAEQIEAINDYPDSWIRSPAQLHSLLGPKACASSDSDVSSHRDLVEAFPASVSRNDSMIVRACEHQTPTGANGNGGVIANHMPVVDRTRLITIRHLRSLALDDVTNGH